MVSPDAGDLVDQRLRRRGILDDVDEREIRNDMRIGERREGIGGEREARERDARRDIEQPPVPRDMANERHDGVDDRERQS